MTDTTTDTPEPDQPTRLHGTGRGWRIAAACAGALLIAAASVGVTAAVMDDGDDDDHEQVTQPSGRDVVDDDDEALARAATVTPERASAIALDAAGGGVVTDLDLDAEGGRLVYEVEIHNADRTPSELQVLLDAETGEVVAVLDHD